MYSSFKRTRTRTLKRVRRSAASAMTDLWKAALKPATPAKRKAVKKVKATPTATKTSSKRSGTSSTASLKSAQTGKRKTPSTSTSRTTPPPGATFAKGLHTSPFGDRSYRLYVPAAARTAAAPLPLVVMLHGCSQTPEDFAQGTGMNALAEEFGFLVLYPAQARKAEVNRCWNWYKRGDQIRGEGEPALIASLTRRIIADHAIDPARIYVAGLSAGAAAALIAAMTYPDIFAAAGAHSGLPLGAAHDGASAIMAMQHGAPGRQNSVRMPTICFHGDADRVVNPRNGRFVAARALESFAGLQKTERKGQVPGGRSYVRIAHRVGKGRSFAEHWVVDGAGHAWSGGNSAGSFTDPSGPDSSREMIRFFLRHRTTLKQRKLADA